MPVNDFIIEAVNNKYKIEIKSYKTGRKKIVFIPCKIFRRAIYLFNPPQFKPMVNFTI